MKSFLELRHSYVRRFVPVSMVHNHLLFPGGAVVISRPCLAQNPRGLAHVTFSRGILERGPRCASRRFSCGGSRACSRVARSDLSSMSEPSG